MLKLERHRLRPMICQRCPKVPNTLSCLLSRYINEIASLFCSVLTHCHFGNAALLDRPDQPWNITAAPCGGVASLQAGLRQRECSPIRFMTRSVSSAFAIFARSRDVPSTSGASQRGPDSGDTLLTFPAIKITRRRFITWGGLWQHSECIMSRVGFAICLFSTSYWRRRLDRLRLADVR
jgi:hypothetical protein